MPGLTKLQLEIINACFRALLTRIDKASKYDLEVAGRRRQTTSRITILFFTFSYMALSPLESRIAHLTRAYETAPNQNHGHLRSLSGYF